MKEEGGGGGEKVASSDLLSNIYYSCYCQFLLTRSHFCLFSKCVPIRSFHVVEKSFIYACSVFVRSFVDSICKVAYSRADAGAVNAMLNYNQPPRGFGKKAERDLAWFSICF